MNPSPEKSTMSAPPPGAAEIAIRKRILDWCSGAFPFEVRDEAARIYHDYSNGQNSEEIEAYTTDLKFGTGGLRGVIGNGAGRMNRWTVGRVALALGQFLKQTYEHPSIVIAYDSRRMSVEFATTTAGIAASLGIHTHLFEGVAPTPLLSYAIRKLKASGGVVITASHNPPEYNGFKAYQEDGSQLVGEAQETIERNIDALKEWSEIPFLSEDDPRYKQHVSYIGEEIKKSYYNDVKGQLFVSSPSNPSKKSLQIVYSPLHGTGGPWLPPFLHHFGFDVHIVEEQAKPDGEFPTVKYPNPEEAEALHLCEETAIALNAGVFLATDPDADRMGAGIKQQEGSYFLLNGNQIGSIMCAYLCEKAKAKKKEDAAYHVIKTIVTTDLQREIAKENGVVIHDVLTGFKYIAEQMRYIEEGSHGYRQGVDRFLFGGEESYGYLPVDFVRDKDSLSSTLLFCEILAEKEDILSYLNQIYLKYGLYLELLKSVTMKGASGQEKIKTALDRIRSESPVGMVLGERKVVAFLDYLHQTKNGSPSPEEFQGLPASNVLQLILEPEGKLTIRPSGTEPKVKLYASLKAPEHPHSLDELETAKEALQNELISIAGIFFAKTGLG